MQLFLGDCREVMATMPANSIDAIVTDPPYGLSDHKPQDVMDCLRAWLDGKPYAPSKRGFMNKSWDGWVAGPEVWREALRVLKPGGHLLCFAGTRSMDLVSMAIRLAGFELRDSIGYAHDSGGAPLMAWVQGAGFPKSHDISKQLDRMAGAEREVVGYKPIAYPDSDCWGVPNSNSSNKGAFSGHIYGNGEQEIGFGKGAPITAPATDEARQWDGWGTALKPAWEPIIMAMKPLDGTFAHNALKWGVAGINIDASRIPANGESLARPFGYGGISAAQLNAIPKGTITGEGLQGRWPANLLLDIEAARALDEMSGPCKTGGAGVTKAENIKRKWGGLKGTFDSVGYEDTTTGASRFFYVAKASKRDRDEGLEGMPEHDGGHYAQDEWSRQNMGNTPDAKRAKVRNHHPTVKPTQLMRYLVRLVTPPGGTVLDCFAGSGSTLKAAILEGFDCVGIELDPEYLAIAQARCDHAVAKRIADAQLQLPLLAAG